MSERGKPTGVQHLSRATAGRRPVALNRARAAEQLRAAYEQGTSVRVLARGNGWSYGYVHRLLHESHTAMRPPGAWRRPNEVPAHPGRRTDP